jgi:hypothetical protein
MDAPVVAVVHGKQIAPFLSPLLAGLFGEGMRRAVGVPATRSDLTVVFVVLQGSARRSARCRRATGRSTPRTSPSSP